MSIHHFAETLLAMLEIEQKNQADVVRLCNIELKAKGKPPMTPGTMSRYIRGYRPSVEYAAIITRVISSNRSRQIAMAVAYLRDIAHSLGLKQDEVAIITEPTEPTDLFQAMPGDLRRDLLFLGMLALDSADAKALLGDLASLCRGKESPVRLMVAEPGAKYEVKKDTKK